VTTIVSNSLDSDAKSSMSLDFAKTN